MNRPAITAIATWVPDAMPLSRCAQAQSALRVTGRPGWEAWTRSWQPDYGHWLEAWRGGETGGPSGCDVPLSDASCMVPVETGTDLSGLAAQAADMIVSARPAGAAPIDVVMFCHSSPGENIPATTAGRLCAQIGTPCLAFSVSQQQAASLFTALRLAADFFTAEPDIHTILIVAAEKWYPPFSRWACCGMIRADAAGALLVERTSHVSGGLSLLDAEVRHVLRCNPHPAMTPIALRAATLTILIEALLARHYIGQDDINEVVGHQGVPSLTRAVCSLLHRPVPRFPRENGVHLGTAESIVRLARMTRRTVTYDSRRTLLWGVGAGGFVGAALLEAHGLPVVLMHRP